ncbi:MAG: zinc resistance-associated protein [Thermodesulfobacteriota bacterium]|nr:zinc resistance-associated protein [Thermodesulfobacteriota bacterium]
MGKGFPGILLISVLVTLVITNFASGGIEYRPGGKQHMKSGNVSGYGSRNMRNLSEDVVRKMNGERDAFFRSTEKVRQYIFMKERELNNELSKTRSDVKKALMLQKEISELESIFDQKRIEYMINIKKINPDLAIRFGSGGASIENSCRE